MRDSLTNWRASKANRAAGRFGFRQLGWGSATPFFRMNVPLAGGYPRNIKIVRRTVRQSASVPGQWRPPSGLPPAPRGWREEGGRRRPMTAGARKGYPCVAPSRRSALGLGVNGQRKEAAASAAVLGTEDGRDRDGAPTAVQQVDGLTGHGTGRGHRLMSCGRQEEEQQVGNHENKATRSAGPAYFCLQALPVLYRRREAP